MKNLLIFLAGLGIGAGTSWYLTKTECTKKYNSEVVNKVYSTTPEPAKEETPEEPEVVKLEAPKIPEVNSIHDFRILAKEYNPNINTKKEVAKVPIEDPIRAVGEEDLDTVEGYDTVYLSYYGPEGLLVDNANRILDEKITIGDCIDKAEDDPETGDKKVIVQNDNDKCYYVVDVLDIHFDRGEDEYGETD